MLSHFAYVRNLVRFAFRANPLLYVSMLVSLISTGIELLAMSSLFPLFQVASGTPPASGSLVGRMLTFLGLPVKEGPLLWAFIVLLGLRIATQLVGQSLSVYLGKRVLAQLGSRAFDQIIRTLPIREINEKSIGFYIGIAGDEAFRASTLVISLTQFVSIVTLAVLYFSAIAVLSPAISGLVIVFMTVSTLALLGVLRISQRLGVQRIQESRRATTLFLDSLNNLKTVRAFSVEGYVSGVYRQVIFGYSKILFWIEEVSLSSRLVPILVLLTLFAGWLTWSSGSIEHVGLALIVTTIVYLMRFFPVVGEGAQLLFKIVSDAKSGQDVTEMLNARAESPPARVESLGTVEHIELQGVGFSFEDGAGKTILDGVDLRLVRGKSYALAGRSGVGKSTLADLVLKFYLPSRGQLRINGIPLSEVKDSEIRKRIILVSQEAAIFDDTVINNVRLGLTASTSEVEAACRTSCIHDEIAGMAQGYETRLQYQGKNLSGGQRQRIAIARALLRKPDVLVFDESTSALDKPTQEVLVGNVLRESANRIVVFVTHDPQIMSRVDEVVDLEKLNAVVKNPAEILPKTPA